MPRKIVYLFVNGIMTFPGSGKNWTGKAVTWNHVELGIISEKIEYFSGALFSRSIGQKARAKKLIKTLMYYIIAEFDIVLVGHSNGCDVILDALKEMSWPKIKEVHLISGACEADFDKNELNLSGKQIGLIRVYVAGKDKALKMAATFLGRLLGYGSLGKTGTINSNHDNVETIVEPEFGHSDWFAGRSFNETMLLITNKKSPTE